MASSERYFDPRALARIGRLELRVRTVVEGIISGLHRSPYNGQSVEFVDHREYVPGDDPRHIDWKVLGRADRIVIKRYEEDTNLRGHLLLDASESMRFGHGVAARERLSKYDYAATLAASMGYLLRRQHDAIGLSLFDSEIRDRIPLSTHPSALHQVAEAMERTEPTRKTGLEPVLRELADDIPRRGLVVLFSALFAPIEEIEAGLQHFVVRRHDVVVFHTLDETELTFPFEGNTLFKGLEDYPEVLVEPRSLRDAYLEAMSNFLDQVRDVCARLGVDYRLIHNGEPVDVPIISIVSRRAQLGRRAT